MFFHVLNSRLMFDLLWFCLLLTIFIYFWRIRRRTVLTKFWKKTTGRVIRCEWEISDYRLWPKILYTYGVDHDEYLGEDYFLDKIHHDLNSTRLRNLAYKVVSAYKKNINIDVYYNPTNPTQSVLDKKVPYKLNIILALILLLIFIHVGFVGIRLMR